MFNKKLIYLILMLSGSLACLNSAYSQAKVFINEVAWMGSIESGNCEWIELYNKEDSQVDLGGWKIKAIDGSPEIELTGLIEAGGYFLLERTSDGSVPNISANLIYSGALSNSGETLELFGNSNALIDKVESLQGWMAGDNSAKLTMSRQTDGTWTNSGSAGGTPKAANDQPIAIQAVCGNSAIESGEACDDGNVSNGDGCDSNCQTENQNSGNAVNNPGTQSSSGTSGQGTQTSDPEPGDVLINEVMADPGKSENEWIELANMSGREMNMEGWSIEEGSGQKTVISGIMPPSILGKYWVIENLKGNLNNAGDIVTLKDSSGNIIDKLAYGDWKDGDLSDNAPAAEEPNSLARKPGSNTKNNADDFSITNQPTKGSENVISAQKENAADVNIKAYINDNILITELLINPLGEDYEGEFIEIYNNSSSTIDLSGWRIENDDGQSFELDKLENKSIQPQKYLALFRKQTDLVLMNSGGTIRLIGPDKAKAIQTIKYNEAEESMSYCLEDIVKDKWELSLISTPNSSNVFQSPNSPPKAVFSIVGDAIEGNDLKFDSSDTFDIDLDKLSFSWTFGDKAKSDIANPSHAYKKAGSYKVVLAVSDSKATSTYQKSLKIDNSETETDKEAAANKTDKKIKIYFNEICPNPAGSDRQEWLELYNPTDQSIGLGGWSIERANSQRTHLNNGVVIGPKGYLVLKNEKNKISLKNSGDTLKLIDQENRLIDKITYPTGKEALSYAKVENAWIWTKSLTPGKANGKPIKADLTSINIKNSKTKKSIAKKTDNTEDRAVKIRGVVGVAPGMFAAQYFYLLGETNAQIYNYKKDFPDLKIGDLIEVNGIESDYEKEYRIKTKTKNDIQLIKSEYGLEANTITCEASLECKQYEVVEVSGEITKKKGSILYIDDGTAETQVYIKKKTGIVMGNYQEGQMIRAVGIVFKNGSETSIMPRTQDDIVKMDTKSTEGYSPRVLGIETSKDFEIAKKDKNIELLKYALATTIAGIVILLGWMMRHRFIQ